MKVLSLSQTVLLANLGVALLGCNSGEPPPKNCGDPTMSIVTFRGNGDEDSEIRACIDLHAASRRDASATSAGLDEGYAVTQPNAIPWTAVTFRGAVEACGRAGKFLCNRDELRAITPIAGIQGGSGTIQWDETAISALAPTSDVESLPHRFDRLNPVDMVIRGDTGKPAYPESTGSVAYWTTSPEQDDDEQDPSIALMIGRLQGDSAVGGYLLTTPVLDDDFQHPLLGFRCCINARMRSAFEPVNVDARFIREEAPDVPIQGE